MTNTDYLSCTFNNTIDSTSIRSYPNISFLVLCYRFYNIVAKSSRCSARVFDYFISFSIYFECSFLCAYPKISFFIFKKCINRKLCNLLFIYIYRNKHSSLSVEFEKTIFCSYPKCAVIILIKSHNR